MLGINDLSGFVTIMTFFGALENESVDSESSCVAAMILTFVSTREEIGSPAGILDEFEGSRVNGEV